MQKVSEKVLKDCKKLLEFYKDLSITTPYKGKWEKADKKAEKLVKTLEEEYHVG